MDLEDIMLSKIRHRRTNTVGYHLYVESKNAKLIEIESRMVVMGGAGSVGAE